MNEPHVLPYAPSPQVGGVTVQREAGQTIITVNRLRPVLIAISITAAIDCLIGGGLWWWGRAATSWRGSLDFWFLGSSFALLAALLTFSSVSALIAKVRPIVWTVNAMEATLVVRHLTKTVRERYPASILTELHVDRVRLKTDLWPVQSLAAILPNGNKLVLLRARRSEMVFAEDAFRNALGLSSDPLQTSDYAPLCGRVERKVIKRGVILTVKARRMLTAAATVGAATPTLALAALLYVRRDASPGSFDLALVLTLAFVAAFVALLGGLIVYGFVAKFRTVEVITLNAGHLTLRRDGLGSFEVDWPANDVKITTDERGGLRFTPLVGQPFTMLGGRSAAEVACVLGSLKVAYQHLRDRSA